MFEVHRYLCCVKGFFPFVLQILALFFKGQGEKLDSKPVPSPRKPEVSVLMLELAGHSFRPSLRWPESSWLESRWYLEG